MPGTVNAIIPLSLLEAVRSVDIPEGDDIDVEYVQEHRNKYLGASVRRVGSSIVVGIKESVTFQSAPKGIGCLYYESALREMLRLLVNGGGMIDHVHCRERGEDICEWRAEWRAVKTSP